MVQHTTPTIVNYECGDPIHSFCHGGIFPHIKKNESSSFKVSLAVVSSPPPTQSLPTNFPHKYQSSQVCLVLHTQDKISSSISVHSVTKINVVVINGSSPYHSMNKKSKGLQLQKTHFTVPKCKSKFTLAMLLARS